MSGTWLVVIAALAVSLPNGALPEGGSYRPASRSQRMRPFSPEQVRRTLARRLGGRELADLQIPFEADGRIRRLSAEITRGAHDDHQKLAALRRYFHEQGFLRRYDRDGTRTARQVAETGEGNCLSYANLFVAMARSVGLSAHYLDASERVTDFGKSGSVLVKYGHVLVGVCIGPEWIAIDFDGRAGRPERFRVISDLEVIADYYNNLGSERAWASRGSGGFGSPQAIRAFDLATRIAPGFSRAWNNLGVALARAGRARQALGAYRRAAQTDPRSAAPWANLGQLHRHRGDTRAARRAFERAVDLSPGNAHYRTFLGRLLLEQGATDEAERQLSRAASLDDTLFLPHLLLAELHQARGDGDAAAREARRVLELVPGQRDAGLLLRSLGVRQRQ